MIAPTITSIAAQNSVVVLPSSRPAGAEAQVLAATIELLMELESSDSLENAVSAIQTRLMDFIEAADLLVGQISPSDQSCRLIGGSGSAEATLTDDQKRIAEYALDEILIRGAGNGCRDRFGRTSSTGQLDNSQPRSARKR